MDLSFTLCIWLDLSFHQGQYVYSKMHRVGVSNFYFLGILIKLLNGWHQILFLPAMGFSLKENDPCKVALGLFNVGPSAAHLCFYVALPMFFYFQ